MQKLCVIVPNWNGVGCLPACLDSLLAQSTSAHVIVVENGSSDGSVELLARRYPEVEVLAQSRNLGFAEGVNVGIRRAMKLGAEYVALFNNDAVAAKDWLFKLVAFMDDHQEAGIATCKLMSADKKRLDSTGDMYTTWGLPYPRGRDEPVSDKYDKDIWVFGASGGASLYRTSMFKQIGLFDRRFFAYYEDVDISFRAQLAGWKVAYVPAAEAYHKIGATSSKISGFATYQTLKNLPLLYWKNVPWSLVPKMQLRYSLAYSSILFSALARGQFTAAAKGAGMAGLLLPRAYYQRWLIRKLRRVPVGYIDSILVHDLPPNARRLRALRQKWWQLLGRDSA